jgi:hypothetical protein
MHVQLTAPTWRSPQRPRESCTGIDKRRVLLIVLESQSVGAIGKDKTIRGMYLFQKTKKATTKKQSVDFSVICSAQLRLRHRETMSWSSIKAANGER